MFPEVYKTIERKYEDRRNSATYEYQLKKEEAYQRNPRLAEIDKKIALLGIQSSKAALISDDATKENLKADLKSKLTALKLEKENILNTMQICLTPHYVCEKCQDTGYITTTTGSEMCSCLKQEILNEAYNKSNLYRLKSDTFDNFNSELFSNEPDVEKYGVAISPKQNIEKIKEISQTFIENFENPNQKNLLFTGTPGIGKTFLSSCIANEVLKKGYTVLYQTSPLLLDSIFESKFNNKYNSTKENLFQVNLLIIDDLGTENLTAAKFTELFTIINTRLLNPNTKTIISTNLSLEDLAKNYDDRILSRLIGNFHICKFFGEDIRLKT